MSSTGVDDAHEATFQVTVIQLTLSSQLSEQDIRVTVSVGDVSKITCSGEQSEDGLVVTWNHPFLFTASSSVSVRFAIHILPELTLGWDKQPLGDQIVVNVTNLWASDDVQQYNVLGLSKDVPATLTVTCKATNILTLADGHDCLSALNEYDVKLYKFGLKFQCIPCLSTKMEVGLTSLDLCPLGHVEHPYILDHLACSFHCRYEQGGNVSDLYKAIEIYQTILDLCPLSHPFHTWALGELALCLRKLYYIQENKADLNMVIEMQEKRLILCPSDHPEHERALGTLAMSLLDRYRVQGYTSDLNRCIEMGERWLELCPPGHLFHDEALGNLALAVNERYNRQGNLVDLNRAIDLNEKELELYPPGHQNLGLVLKCLAECLVDHFHASGTHSDLIRAIKLNKKALDILPVQHHEYAHGINELATISLLLFKQPPPDQHPPSLDETFEAYGQLKGCSPAASLALLKATQAWIKNAEEYHHSSIMEAYQTALTALDHFTSFSSSLDSRHETMQTRVVDVANDAFSCAIRHGELQKATEFLEQGRGILWNQLARFDMSIAALESQGDEGRTLGNRFTLLNAHLRNHAQGSGGTEAYWRQWESVVDRIRQLEGFSRFLLPPRFEDLQQAAECGPVIIVNASTYSCDALIVVRTGPPVHVPLPTCSITDIIQLCLQLSELTQDAHAYGNHRESYVKQMLRDLWSSVVEPIVTVLQDDIQPPPGSRIWWCPTSKFTNLPLHAAGPYRKAQRNLMDIYISSYAPSLSALVRACDRIRSQEVARDASGTVNLISFAAVGQGWPGADAKLSTLPEVEHEIRRIRSETGIPLEVEFNAITGDAATIEGAAQAFRDHDWVHVACHGAQHAERPFDSWFAMGDGKLTLMRIIQERYTNSEFAFLSACHTAVGDASTPDEVLHLAGGMQFVGFNGVIGTLWRVDDAVAHQVVTRFYKEMFKHPVPSFEHAAAALNTAAVETADEVSLEKRIVFVHIGI